MIKIYHTLKKKLYDFVDSKEYERLHKDFSNLYIVENGIIKFHLDSNEIVEVDRLGIIRQLEEGKKIKENYIVEFYIEENEDAIIFIKYEPIEVGKKYIYLKRSPTIVTVLDKKIKYEIVEGIEKETKTKFEVGENNLCEIIEAKDKEGFESLRENDFVTIKEKKVKVKRVFKEAYMLELFTYEIFHANDVEFIKQKKEMTVEEIEKALKLKKGSLKVIGDK